MAMDKATEKAIPAYVSYKTHVSALVALKEHGVPAALDRSSLIMRRMSGTAQSQLRSSWRFLGLIDDADRPQPLLRRLIEAPTTEDQKTILREVLTVAYPFLLGPEATPFDITNATARQFSEKFSLTGASGETLRKCEAFFLKAAKEAGIQVSNHIIKARSGGDEPKRASRPSSSTKQRTSNVVSSTKAGGNEAPNYANSSTEQEKVAPTVPTPSDEDAEVRALRQLLPPFPSEGEIEEKKLWYEEMREFRKWVQEYIIAKIKAVHMINEELEV